MSMHWVYAEILYAGSTEHEFAKKIVMFVSSSLSCQMFILFTNMQHIR